MSVLYGIFCWTNIILLISQVLSEAQFNAGLQIYLLGIPVVVILILTLKDDRMQEILVPIAKFLKGEEALNQINQIITLIKTRETDRESSVLIKGYVDHHEHTCIEGQCALKAYKRSLLK